MNTFSIMLQHGEGEYITWLSSADAVSDARTPREFWEEWTELHASHKKHFTPISWIPDDRRRHLREAGLSYEEIHEINVKEGRGWNADLPELMPEVWQDSLPTPDRAWNAVLAMCGDRRTDE